MSAIPIRHVALLLMIAASLAGSGRCIANGPKVNCMVAIFGWSDWKIGAAGAGKTSDCILQVRRAAQRCSKYSLKITPYFYYSWALPANRKPGEDKSYRHIATRWLVRNPANQYVTPTRGVVQAYTRDFSACLNYAAAKGFKEIYVSPMIDPNYNQPDCCPYRNTVEFNPLQRFPGAGGQTWSYQTLVVHPTLAAMSPIMKKYPAIKWKYSLGAEQGRGFVTSAPQWTALSVWIRRVLGNPSKARLGIGPSFNWDGLCGKNCQQYDASKTQITAVQFAQFRKFMLSADFFGISNYPNVWSGYNTNTKSLDHLAAIRNFDTEMTKYARISIARLRQAGKMFVLNEHGIGGCESFGCNGVTTRTIYQLATNAHVGTGSIRGDGNTLRHPWRYPWQSSFRMEWYRQFLQQYRSGMGGYAPKAAYIWSVGSWDPFGVYPLATKGNPDIVGCNKALSFCDPTIAAMIRRFNIDGYVPRNSMYNLP